MFLGTGELCKNDFSIRNENKMKLRNQIIDDNIRDEENQNKFREVRIIRK